MTSAVFRATRRLLVDLSPRSATSLMGKGGGTRQIVSVSSSSSSGVSSPSSSSTSSMKGTVQVSDACKKRLREILDEGSFLRVSVEGGGCSGFQYIFAIDKDLSSDDVVLHKDSGESRGSAPAAMVVMDELSLDLIQGSTVDYETELIRSTFRVVNNPRAEQGCSCGASFNMKIQL